MFPEFVLGPAIALKQVCAGPRTSSPHKVVQGFYCLSGPESKAAQGLQKKFLTLLFYWPSLQDSFFHFCFGENGSPRGKVKRHNSKKEATRNQSQIQRPPPGTSELTNQAWKEVLIQWGHFKDPSEIRKNEKLSRDICSPIFEMPPLYYLIDQPMTIFCTT